jgi:hypothetical protein
MLIQNKKPLEATEQSLSMADLITLSRFLIELVRGLERSSRRRLAQPLLTVVLLVAAYASIHIGQEGSVSLGLRAAFLDNDASRLERSRMDRQILLQSELKHFAAANALIDQHLEYLLAHSRGASRVRMHVIHNGVTGLTGTGLLRYDVTNIVASPGRALGANVQNAPLADLGDFLPGMLAGQCTVHRTSDLHAGPMLVRLVSLGVSSVMACPSADVQGKLVGALLISWDGADAPPEGIEMRALMDIGHHVGDQIAAVLDLQGPPPWPSENHLGN